MELPKMTEEEEKAEKEAFDRYMKKYGHIRPICYKVVK